MFRVLVFGAVVLGVLALLGIGSFVIYLSLTEETFAANIPMIYATLGTGAILTAFLLYLSAAVSVGLRRLRELHASIEKNTATNIQIAKRLQQEQKHQTQ